MQKLDYKEGKVGKVDRRFYKSIKIRHDKI